MAYIKTITIKNSNYPQILKEINDPPKLLYYRGNLDAFNYKHAIAIVGTRRCSQEGREITRKIAGELAKAGITIISGMARGIDTCAHEAALNANTTTIAVLGSALEDKYIYPQQNVSLAHKIIDSGGLIISEYAAEDVNYKSNFPQRNRIVAGLSNGTLVIEAPLKSGARITARLANEYNRDVYVVPGPIFSYLYKGSNQLIKQGARCVTSADDIMQDMGLEHQNSIKNTLKTDEKLNKEERAVLKIISESSNATHIDKITDNIKLGSIEISQIISSLMLEGLIHETEPNKYITTQ